MVSNDQIKTWVLASLKNVQANDATYAGIAVNDQTLVLGPGSPFDSIAFTAFATDLEEKIEDATGEPFVLKVDELFSRLKGRKMTAEAIALALPALIDSARSHG